ncbi:chemotaxis protein CheE [Brevundimonas vesicularis]|uniref:chemotaxis protein CheE n=1 Tax=Brevundimonas vesicularis TaxID=41276 RepID=UPI0038D502DA
MTVITHNRRRSRLSTLIDQPGGISVSVALDQARENLAPLAGRSREIIEAEIQALTDLAAPTDLGANGEAMNRAYLHANTVIDAACPFEMRDLCAAASNLCDLLDAAPEDQVFDWRIVTVHAQSMRLLLSLDNTAGEARAQVLASLQDVLKARAGPSDDSPA